MQAISKLLKAPQSAEAAHVNTARTQALVKATTMISDLAGSSLAKSGDPAVQVTQ